LTTNIKEEFFMLKSISEITAIIESTNPRSYWGRGVKTYALELLEELPKNVEYGSPMSLSDDLLNGARNWNNYSWGGCSLIYDGDIAKRLCTPSELRKTKNGELRPNKDEEWLDTQARALCQAAHHIQRAAAGRAVIM
jgi:hypothetical protein